MDLEDLTQRRAALARLDARILSLIAERQRQSLEIGRIKAAMGRGTRDFTRERVVVEHARDHAHAVHMNPDLAQRLIELLIEASLSVQEQDRITTADTGDGRRAYLVGGAGRMGRWFASLLSAQGWDPIVIDPASGDRTPPSMSAALQQRPARAHDLVLFTTPPPQTAALLDALCDGPPAAVVAEISSVKASVLPSLYRLRDAGGRVTSLHPMFGPNTSLLSGRRVLLCDLGVPEATDVVRQLFSPTMADLVDVAPEEHDQLVAWILNSSHALSLMFGDMLARSGLDPAMLFAAGSQTFDAQRAISREVLREDPDLHGILQSENPSARQVLEAAAQALRALQRAAGDPEQIAAMMTRGLTYLSNADNPPAPSQG